MKKLLAVFLVFAALTVSVFANTNAIDGSNLPLDNEEFVQKSNLFLQNYNYSSSWHYEWNFDKPREQVIDELKDFNDYLGSIKKATYDVKLLRLITMRCLYNLDEISSDEIKAYADQLKKKYKKDYRTWWIYGNFLATTSLVAESYEEFRTAIKMNEGYVTAPFIDNYVYSCIISGNVKHGWLALNSLAEMDEIPVEQEYFYPLYENHLIFPKVTDEYDKNQVWKISPKDEGIYSVFSTLMGIGVTVKGEWGLNLFNFENGQTGLTVSPEKFKAKDKTEIGVTLALLAGAREDSYDTYKNAFKHNYTMPMTESVKTINGIEFEVYEGEDLTTYADVRGGQRGIYLLCKIPYDVASGLGLESSHSFSLDEKSDSESDGPKYYAAQPVLDRIPETVSVLIMFDTCNAVYKDSSKWFWDFVEQCKFE